MLATCFALAAYFFDFQILGFDESGFLSWHALTILDYHYCVAHRELVFGAEDRAL